MPAQVIFPGIQGRRPELRLHPLEEIWHRHVEALNVGGADPLEVPVPIEGGGQSDECFPAHFVVQVLGLAALHPFQRDFGQGRLDLHDVFRRGGGPVGGITEQLEGLRHVFQVLLASLLGFVVLLQVVVPIGQSQPALVGIGDHHAGVLVIPLGVEAEGGRSPGAPHHEKGSLTVEPRHLRRQLRLGLQLRDAIQLRLQRRDAFPFRSLLVDAGGVQVADLLHHRGPAGVRRGGFLQDPLQHRQVVLLQLATAPVGAAIRRDRIVFHPAAAGELVEVHTGIHAAIQAVEIEGGRFPRLRRPGNGGRQGEGQQGTGQC